MTMIDPVTRLDPEVQRMTAQAVADLAYSLRGECEAVRMARSEGIEPRDRPELRELEKAGEVYRKAHEDACAMAAGVKVARRGRGPNKLTIAAALKEAAKHSLEVTANPDGTMKFRPVTKANDNSKGDPTVNPWDRVLHVKD
jgi:hypothetical protein